MLFTPPVTTQFISNVERGVTPLPPAHIPTLTQALMVNESEFMALMEQEYTYKLSGRIGKGEVLAPSTGVILANGIRSVSSASAPALTIAEPDFQFMRNLYDAYQHADASTRQTFASLCERVFNLTKSQVASLSAPQPPLSQERQ